MGYIAKVHWREHDGRGNIVMEELLNQLQRKGVTLWLEGDKIRYRGAPEAITSELLQQLRNYRPELVEFLKQANLAKPFELPPIRRSTSNSFAPASPAQARLWFLSRLEAESVAYTIPQAYEIEGVLDTVALQRAIGFLIERHESLRTTLISAGTELHQRVAAFQTFELPILEFTGESGAGARATALKKVNEWAQEPFELEKGPLFRARLLKIGVEQHLLFFAFHHAITDGWSLRIFYQELAACYTAFVRGTEPQLPEIPVRYGDFAIAQAEAAQSPELQRELAYWKERLSGAPARLRLPHDYPRTIANRGSGAAVGTVLPPALWESLGNLSRVEGATPFMALLAVFQLWLGRLAGVEDIVVGTPIAGRQRPEIQQVIGLFLNNLALRGDLSGQPTFRELLRKTRSSTLDAFAHQELPFDRLVTELNPERSLSYPPLFQVMINQLEQSADLLDLAGLETSPLAVFDLYSKYDLTLYSTPRTDGTRLELVYNKELFSPARAGEMLHQFEGLLRQIIDAPDLPVRNFSLVTANSARLLPTPSEPVEAPPQETVMVRFADMLGRYPDRAALVHGSHSWTYTQLDDAVDRIAGILNRAGVRKGNVVAITGPSSPGLVAATLAVWRLGAILTLLDPRLPQARKRLMAEQSSATHWLQVGPGEDTPPPLQALRSIDIPADPDSLPAPLPFEPNDYPDAYIFFTSGTTGVPKAILGTHQGLGHFLNWQRSTFAIGPGDRVAQLTGLSFDVILRDIFLPLTSGATLCLPKLEGDLAGDRVLPWLEREQITLLHTVPSLATTWLNSGPDAALSALRWVFLAGEPLAETLPTRWREKFPRSGHLVNLYGPTETTLAKLFFHVPNPALPGIQPVGRPLPQTQAWILNETGRLCGVGEPGEIVIRTPFRSAGYLNAPAEVANKFRPNPFRNDPKDLVYFTGDRGHYLPDGTVGILGRNDRQVKVNGVRVELDEVNLAVSACPGVDSSAVVPHRGPSGELRLIAYISGALESLESLPAKVRSTLSQILPTALMPSEIIAITRMPLTPNGKINIPALPPPGSRTHPTGASAKPSGPVEERIASIWGELIGTSPIDAGANFFEVGGHSLLGLQLVARIRQAFGRDISLRHLFLEPTIQGLARVVADTPAAQLQIPEWCRSIHALQPGGNRPPLFIFPGGNGGDYELYVHARFATRDLGLDQPVFAFKSRGAEGAVRPHASMAEMVRDYLAELRQVQPRGPYFFLGDCLGGNIAFTLACALQAQGEEVPFLALADCARPRPFEYPRYWLRNRFRRFRVSLAGRIIFNWHRLIRVATPSGRQWLRTKLQPASQTPSEAPRTPFKPVPALEYWSPQGERYRRAVTSYSPGQYRGRLHLIVCEQNQSSPLLLAWEENATQGIECHILPGDHWTYLWNGAPQLARLCRAAIDATTTDTRH